VAERDHVAHPIGFTVAPGVIVRKDARFLKIHREFIGL
jgi:hypothetical protein